MQQDIEPLSGRSVEPLDRLAVDTIRMLAIDAVQHANSGHPGTPLALAPIAYTLWARFRKYDPDAPHWPNRDRFVMSNGDASMLLYSRLHLADVEELDATGRRTGSKAVSLDDIKSFRQLDSKTPGHPEYRLTTGVETTTGPLGQGCGNSVGMAIAERWLGARYNRDGFTVFDHDVYAFCGDATDAAERLSREGCKPRVVSMPSSDIFERQDQAYRDDVLPPSVSARVAIEQASEFGWGRYVGRGGRTVTMTTFGASAPIDKLQERFGFTVDNVITVCRAVMSATR